MNVNILKHKSQSRRKNAQLTDRENLEQKARKKAKEETKTKFKFHRKALHPNQGTSIMEYSEQLSSSLTRLLRDTLNKKIIIQPTGKNKPLCPEFSFI